MLLLFSTAFAGGGTTQPSVCRADELVVKASCTVTGILAAPEPLLYPHEIVRRLTTLGTIIEVIGCAMEPVVKIRVRAPDGYTTSLRAHGDVQFSHDLPGSAFEPWPHTSGYTFDLREGRLVVTATVEERLNPPLRREDQVAVVSCTQP